MTAVSGKYLGMHCWTRQRSRRSGWTVDKTGHNVVLNVADGSRKLWVLERFRTPEHEISDPHELIEIDSRSASVEPGNTTE
jgi:hypothetical protein